MADKKILQGPSHVAKLPKFSHDMSQVKKFTSYPAQLLPVYYDFLYPGDKVRFSTEMFTQIDSLVSPTMMHLEEHVDWFFVPLRQICSTAPEKLFGIDDRHSSLVTDTMMNNQSVVPTFLFNHFNSVYNSLRVHDNSQIYDPSYLELSSLTGESGLDDFGVPNLFNYQRLFELLGYSRNAIFYVPTVSESKRVNPIFACAYQKVFYDYFRITDRTANNVKAYNLDNAQVSLGVSDENIQLMFAMHYRPWKRDFFTNVKVAPLIDQGDISMQNNYNGASLTAFRNYLSSGTASNNSDLSVTGSTINTATQRGMFAVEKLMEITRRAAKHYHAQVKAHYGVDVPNQFTDECIRLGSEKSVFSVDEVMSTSGNQSSVNFLTQRGGKSAAYSPSKKQMSFEAKCHGVLLAVYSAVPNADYRCDGIDKLNIYTRHYDFYKPEFDRLGMQPFHSAFINYVPSDGFENSVQGWTYRYYESKIKPDLVYGAFNTKLTFWSIARPFHSNNWGNNNMIDPRFYYCNPQCLDDVLRLTVQYGDDDSINYENCFARDPLLHWFKFNVFKSSVMSNFSLPQL